MFGRFLSSLMRTWKREEEQKCIQCCLRSLGGIWIFVIYIDFMYNTYAFFFSFLLLWHCFFAAFIKKRFRPKKMKWISVVKESALDCFIYDSKI